MQSSKVAPIENGKKLEINDGSSVSRRLSRSQINTEVEKIIQTQSLGEDKVEKRKSLTILAPFSRFIPSEEKKEYARSLNAIRRATLEKSPTEIDLDTKNQPKCKTILMSMMKSKIFAVLTFCTTFWALFGVDLAVWKLSPESYIIVEGLLFVCLWFFIFELVVQSYCTPQFIGTFYFWMDFFGAISLIPDLTFIIYALTHDADDTDDQSSLAILRTGRIVRTGTRTTKALRVLRIIRFARLFRMFRLFKLFRLYLTNKHLRHLDRDETKPSKLGLQLADLLGKRNVVYVLILLLAIPQLEVAVVDDSIFQGIQILEHLGNVTMKGFISENNVNNFDVDTFSTEFTESLEIFQDLNPNLVEVAISNHILQEMDGAYNNTALGRYLVLWESESHNSWAIVSTYDDAKEQAGYNILLTIMLIVILGVSGYLFNSDVHKKVVQPIIKTTRAIRQLAKTLFLLSAEDNEKDIDESSALQNEFVETVVDKLTAFFSVDSKQRVQMNKIKKKNSNAESSLTVAVEQRPPSPRELIPDKRVLEQLSNFEHFYKDIQAMQFFKVFLTSEFAVESLVFLEKIEYFKAMKKETYEVIEDIIDHFISERADSQVNISDKQREGLLGTPKHEMGIDIFDAARDEIFKQLAKDNFSRFKESPLFQELVQFKKANLKEYGLLKCPCDGKDSQNTETKAAKRMIGNLQ